MPRRDELAAWIRLTLVPGLGGAALRHLLKTFDGPAGVFGASRAKLADAIGQKLADRIGSHQALAAVDHVLDWSERDGQHIVTLGDAAYPARLLEIADPPVLLYVRGNLELLQREAIAIVGSRNATPQGRSNAEAFARALSERGVTVISGMALGVDAAAHLGALEGSASTVGIVGTGADVVYPPRNAALFAAVASRGAIASEFPLGAPPLAGHFPRRNRLISGLARGVLVIEAGLESGSLITARLAAEQGRDVFAVPGSIHSSLSRGCHALIKEGAKLVESVEDVLGELRSAAPVASSVQPPSSPMEQALLEHLGHDPCSLDTLCRRSGLTADTVSAMLLRLELDGKVSALPGGRFQRTA